MGKTLDFELKVVPTKLTTSLIELAQKTRLFLAVFFLPNALQYLLPFPRKYCGLLKPDFFTALRG